MEEKWYKQHPNITWRDNLQSLVLLLMIPLPVMVGLFWLFFTTSWVWFPVRVVLWWLLE